MSVPIERIIEMPLNQGMYLYLCPCGAAEWGKDRWPYFQEGWKARHLESCCSTANATHKITAFEGTQRDMVESITSGKGIVVFTFHKPDERRDTRYKWYMIQEIYK